MMQLGLIILPHNSQMITQDHTIGSIVLVSLFSEGSTTKTQPHRTHIHDQRRLQTTRNIFFVYNEMKKIVRYSFRERNI